MFWWILYYDINLLLDLSIASIVSILVLVDLILWRTQNDKGYGGSIVSILVVVDLILWQDYYTEECMDCIGFNPCFGGSYINDTATAGITNMVIFVSILFWWILYYDAKNKGTIISKGFQSLFWWILYYDRQITQMIVWRLSGFNPCFGGSYIVTVRKWLKYHIVWFQSLFWWILYYDFVYQI